MSLFLILEPVIVGAAVVGGFYLLSKVDAKIVHKVRALSQQQLPSYVQIVDLNPAVDYHYGPQEYTIIEWQRRKSQTRHPLNIFKYEDDVGRTLTSPPLEETQFDQKFTGKHCYIMPIKPGQPSSSQARIKELEDENDVTRAKLLNSKVDDKDKDLPEVARKIREIEKNAAVSHAGSQLGQGRKAENDVQGATTPPSTEDDGNEEPEDLSGE